MITSTLTRPTTIAPTMSCDRKVSYQEDIDVATLFRPKPRVISLEPISRRVKNTNRSRKKIVATNGQTQSKDVVKPDASVERVSVISGRANSTDAEPPQSPSHSDMSYESCPSSCGTGSVADSNPPSVRTGDSKIGKMVQSQTTKPVTATIELQKAGFLRGDLVSVKIHVHHTKHIKSLHGVIVTLYRQARVDVNPPLPKVGSSKAEQESIPKTRTGIGLSITGAGASHLFRKDLSQSFASLIIDPSTLSAEIRATVRVPEEVFPTISTAPGAMITFKYYVEVVLDLQGKLAGLDRFLPNAGMSGISSHTGGPTTGSPADASNSVFAAWGGHFMDTEEIRRDKSVVSCIFEIIIGTRDSERKGKWKQLVQSNGSSSVDTGIQQAETLTKKAQEANGMLGRLDDASRPNGEHIQWAENIQWPEPNISSQNTQGYTNGTAIPTVPLPPNAGAEGEELTEKERIRLAEERLLPSRPPDSDEASSSVAQHAPTAPTLHDGDPPAFVARTTPSYTDPSAPPPHDHDSRVDPPASAPAYERHGFAPSDDKLELQRARLERERSAPDDALGDAGPSAPPPPNHLAAFAPSAPSFDDVDDFGFGAADAHGHGHAEHSLPRYER